MLFSLTVGKVDAGVAVLLTDDNRIIEFPTILLPDDIKSGSIVDIRVAHNTKAQEAMDVKFQNLQTHIFQTFGVIAPSTPTLRCRNVTQTSVVLEWDPIFLATAELRSLTLYRNGSKTGNIPKPMEMSMTKVSGLAVDKDYTFQLELRTTAGRYLSELLSVRTHKMTDLSGVRIACGAMPPEIKDAIEPTAERLGAKIVDSVQIDTTHFLCTEAKGAGWKSAQTLNIPVVHPEWLQECERQNRIVGVRNFYLQSWKSSSHEPSQSQSQTPSQPHSAQSDQHHRLGSPPPDGQAEGRSNGHGPQEPRNLGLPTSGNRKHVSTLSNVTRMSDFVPNDDAPSPKRSDVNDGFEPGGRRRAEGSSSPPDQKGKANIPDHPHIRNASLANMAYSPPGSPIEHSFSGNPEDVSSAPFGEGKNTSGLQIPVQVQMPSIVVSPDAENAPPFPDAPTGEMPDEDEARASSEEARDIKGKAPAPAVAMTDDTSERFSEISLK